MRYLLVFQVLFLLQINSIFFSLISLIIATAHAALHGRQIRQRSTSATVTRRDSACWCCGYVHAHAHLCHAHAHAPTHTYTQAYSYACACVHTHTHAPDTLTCMYSHAHTPTHACDASDLRVCLPHSRIVCTRTYRFLSVFFFYVYS